MNPENQDFESLKKLLAVKKYEQPPPGYFKELPNAIWKRIEANEGKPSFWERFLPAFVLKPAVAYSLALVVCGGLVVTIGMALKGPEAPSTASVKIVTESLAISPIPNKGFGMNTLGGKHEGASTNPVLDPAAFKPGSSDSQSDSAEKHQ